MLSSNDLDLSQQLADSIWLLDGRGSIATGSAESLSKDGAIGAAFDTDDVAFSAQRRRFELTEGQQNG